MHAIDKILIEPTPDRGLTKVKRGVFARDLSEVINKIAL